MLQRSSLPSTATRGVATATGQVAAAEMADSLVQRSLDAARWPRREWRGLEAVLPLPSTWQQYVLGCLALAVVLGGMLLHVLLAVQIAGVDYEVRQMREEYARVERLNSELVYQIALRSSLAQMANLAAEKGYVPATTRTYVVRADAVASAEDVAPAASAAAPVWGGVVSGGGTGEWQDRPVMSGFHPTYEGTTVGAGATDGAPALTWVEQVTRRWGEVLEGAGAATGQLWRDVTGRME